MPEFKVMGVSFFRFLFDCRNFREKNVPTLLFPWMCVTTWFRSKMRQKKRSAKKRWNESEKKKLPNQRQAKRKLFCVLTRRILKLTKRESQIKVSLWLVPKFFWNFCSFWIVAEKRKSCRSRCRSRVQQTRVGWIEFGGQVAEKRKTRQNSRKTVWQAAERRSGKDQWGGNAGSASSRQTPTEKKEEETKESRRKRQVIKQVSLSFAFCHAVPRQLTHAANRLVAGCKPFCNTLGMKCTFAIRAVELCNRPSFGQHAETNVTSVNRFKIRRCSATPFANGVRQRALAREHHNCQRQNPTTKKSGRQVSYFNRFLFF